VVDAEDANDGKIEVQVEGFGSRPCEAGGREQMCDLEGDVD
jgi:hypothetical protein